MNPNIELHSPDGHRVDAQRFQRSCEDGWLGLVAYGPAGGFRASVDLPPAEVARLHKLTAPDGGQEA